MMPISDPEGYPTGHFARVFEDIFVPAIERAGFKPIRADQVRATNLIHLDVLQKLIDAPIALCDLSAHNPNVMFELGLRQAFDKPVVLVQESGTRQIFDIAPLRYAEYRRGRVYHEVLEDQKAIAEAITETVAAHNDNNIGVNSLVKILSLTRPASLPDLQESVQDPGLQLIRAELNELRLELRRAVRPIEVPERDLAEELSIWTRRVRRLYDQHQEAKDDASLVARVRATCSAFAHELNRLERRAVRFRDAEALSRINHMRDEVGHLATLCAPSAEPPPDSGKD